MTKNPVWSGYGGYQGAMVLGKVGFLVSANDDPGRKLLGVVPATEGGHYGDVNTYDRCGVSTGLIQACAAVGLAQAMLGTIGRAAPQALVAFQAWLRDNRGIAFQPNKVGTWTFQRGGVDIPPAQVPVAFWGCGGTPQDWAKNPTLKAQLMTGAVILSDALEHPDAIAPQTGYCLATMLGFVAKSVKPILFADGIQNDGWPAAMQAAYLSFAANLPAVAEKHFLAAVQSFGSAPVDNPDFVRLAFFRMTNGPKIAIYPQRAAAVASYIERVYGLNIRMDGRPSSDPTTIVKGVSTLQLQTRLLELGYDLGPAKADGKFGPKTTAAVKAFQKAKGLEVDGIVGPRTVAALFPQP